MRRRKLSDEEFEELKQTVVNEAVQRFSEVAAKNIAVAVRIQMDRWFGSRTVIVLDDIHEEMTPEKQAALQKWFDMAPLPCSMRVHRMPQ
jgi:hypothetical protein